MDNILARLRDLSGRLTSRQKFQIATAFVATMALIWGVSSYATRVRYGVLYTNLERADAAAVLAELEGQKVPYRLSAGGTIVEVPVLQVEELRLALAGQNLPSGGVGFEIFDKPAFGRSSFEQNVNYKRALERELSRTIQTLSLIESARVHLALPEESVFADEKREPTASVTLKMRSSSSLPTGRVQAITHLVASAVEGLDPRNVSVVDGDGRMLSESPEDEEQMLSASQLEAKRSMERNIESTLHSILEPVVGTGRVRAKATVELNMTRVTRQEETYDPNVAVVRSEEKSKSKSSNGGARPAGAPGTSANLPGSAAGAAGVAVAQATGDETSRSRTEFGLNKTVSNIAEAVGTLARQSVAVVIDHAAGPAAQEGSEGTPPPPVPRTEDELRKITEIVRAAIGVDLDRGDVLTVQNIPFSAEALRVEGSASGFGLDGWVRMLRYLALPIAVLLLAFLVIRPGIAAVRDLSVDRPEEEFRRPPTIAYLQATLQAKGQPGLEAGPPLRQRLMAAAMEDPKTAALVVKNWLGQKVHRG